ncbi:gfo/Idh/MocA family oxidoreductase [Candidatus Bathyarchaeota archaeon]|nr:MAG: gfo/Idh/MocA family oxidoreductase [Candidatus Bathyarchaeota archaeon]
MLSSPVRFGILGLGVGANRARLAAKTEDAELVCVCDLQEEKAKQIAGELNCEWTTRYDDMLRREDIDVIGVFTPSGTHCDYAIKAIQAGKDVFVTKPMDISLEKCDGAIEAARDAGVILAVDFQMRYDETARKMKLALDNGRLGRLILGDLRMKWYRSQEYYEGGYPHGWRKRRETEGGSAANQGVHFIDLLQWFMGPVKTVYGRSGTFAHNIETEDLSMALITFENDAWGSIVTTTASYPRLGSSIEITGDNGSIVWKDGKIILYELKDNPEPSLDEFKLNPERPRNIIEDMVSAIKKGSKVMVDGVEGRKSVAIINAIYKSSKTGKVIELD